MTTHVLTPRRRGRRAIPVLLAVAVVSVGGWLAVRAQSSEAAQTTVTARFADASPLVAGNKVQLDGALVGTIASVALAGDGADVVMALDPSAPPLHTDATVRVEPVSLLGERFIALDPGSQAAPVMSEPMIIPREHTSSAVDVDDLLSTLDRSASTGAAALVGTLGEGIAHQGDNVARALETLPPALSKFNQAAVLLDRQNAVLSDLVVSAEKNATALAGPLDSLVDSAQQTLGVVAVNRRALDGGLAQLPGALGEARRTLTELHGAADNTATVLSGVRPLTDHLLDTSRELHVFADAATPALQSLPALLDKADRMLDEARPVVRELRPAAGRLRDVSGSVRSLNSDLIAHPPGVPSSLENLMTFMSEWSMSANGFDGLSHYFRFKLQATPSAVLTTPASVLPPLSDTRHDPFNPAPPNPNGPDRSATRPYLPLAPSLPNPDGPDNRSHTAAQDPRRTDSGGASGLSQKQESDMFGQLLGGG